MSLNEARQTPEQSISLFVLVRAVRQAHQAASEKLAIIDRSSMKFQTTSFNAEDIVNKHPFCISSYQYSMPRLCLATGRARPFFDADDDVRGFAMTSPYSMGG